MASSLAAVPGKLLAVLFVTHHSDALAPEQCHLFQPTGTIKAQSQIIGKGIRQALRLGLACEWQQQRWQWRVWLLSLKALLDAGVVALLRSVRQYRPYRIEINVGHAGQQG